MDEMAEAIKAGRGGAIFMVNVVFCLDFLFLSL